VAEEGANWLQRQITARIFENGELQCSVQETMLGQVASIQRQELAENSSGDMKKVMEGFVTRNAPGALLRTFSVTHADEADKPLVLKYDFVTGRYGSRLNSLLLFKPTIIERRDEIEFNEPSRKYAVRLRLKQVREDLVQIEIPAGYKVDELPPEENISTEFGEFQTAYKVNGQTITFSRRFIARSLFVPPERYPEFKQFFEKIYNSDQSNVVLVRSR